MFEFVFPKTSFLVSAFECWCFRIWLQEQQLLRLACERGSLGLLWGPLGLLWGLLGLLWGPLGLLWARWG